jgi:rsbT co-antagonist protein RsbR
MMQQRSELVDATPLMRQMGIGEGDVERRLRFVGFVAEDVARVTALGSTVLNHLDEFSTAFFDHLARLKEAAPLMGNRPILDRVRELKKAHLRAMVAGVYGPHYVEERLRLGMLYAQAGLDLRLFLGAHNRLITLIGLRVMEEHADMKLGFDRFVALKKLSFFDLSLIVDVIVYERERIIRAQQEAIRELSTPVLQVRDRLLILPLIGVIDSQRAQLITESVLQSIRVKRAKVLVLDVTGVAAIDSKVVGHLVQTIDAANLMGAKVVVTGLSSDVAQALVALGVNVEKFSAVGDLQSGIELGERLIEQTPQQHTR